MTKMGSVRIVTAWGLIGALIVGQPSYLLAQIDASPTGQQTREGRTQGSISVHVLGAIFQPGTYSCNPTDRLVSVVQKAGGLKPNASETRIELRRARSKTNIVSFFMLKRTGDLKNNPFLQDNDVVFVPHKGPTVIVQGPVQEPGSYEIGEKTSLNDAIGDMALGFTAGIAHGKPIVVIRYDKNNERKTYQIENTPKELSKFYLQDGDIIQAPHKFTVHNVFDDSVASLPNDNIAYPSYTTDVFVLGGVNRPGKFSFVPQHRLSNYVALAGGVTRLGRKDVKVHQISGQLVKTQIDSDATVNPGDTIIVGEDKLGPEFWITFMTTLVGLSLSAVSTYAILGK